MFPVSPLSSLLCPLQRWQDLNVISSLLKSFFRKLPEPLFTDGESLSPVATGDPRVATGDPVPAVPGSPRPHPPALGTGAQTL